MSVAFVDEAGWLVGARHEPSPNSDARPEGEQPTLLVLHAISLPPGEFGSDDVLALFANKLDPARHPYFSTIHSLRVSAHFFIRRDGEVIQLVSCNARAWHAGLSCWKGRERCNDFSIGIELEGCDERPFELEQYAALENLASALLQRYPLTHIAGHSDIAPGRKTDPGPHFAWERIAALPLRRA
ncbi:MAG: 1,6-anhydro-N-acetylmuramyl-L-alanine amidase AmpD [Rhodocyclaceae bacterium]